MNQPDTVLETFKEGILLPNPWDNGNNKARWKLLIEEIKLKINGLRVIFAQISYRQNSTKKISSSTLNQPIVDVWGVPNSKRSFIEYLGNYGTQTTDRKVDWQNEKRNHIHPHSWDNRFLRVPFFWKIKNGEDVFNSVLSNGVFLKKNSRWPPA